MIRTTLSQTHHFTLFKNYLTPHKATDLTQLLGDLVGLPVSDPLWAAQNRLLEVTATSLEQALYNEGSLIRTMVMRNALHLIRTVDYPSLFIATSRQRKQEFNAQFRLWGVENEAIDQLGALILAQLQAQPLALPDLTTKLPTQSLSQTSRGGHTTQTTDVTLALEWLVAQGQVTTGADMLYRPMSQVYPHLDLTQTPTEAEAQCHLVRTYLATYGPANEADVSLWTGLSKSETARAMGMLSTETTLVLVEGLPGMLLMLKNQAEALTQTPPFSEPLITFLPADDPFVTAHRASRGRYFTDQKYYRHVFNSAGIAKPTILLNGQIIGTWDRSAELGLIYHLFTPLEPSLLPYLAEVVPKS